MMAEINVGALRERLVDLFGTALLNGFPTALMDLASIEHMDGYGF